MVGCCWPSCPTSLAAGRHRHRRGAGPRIAAWWSANRPSSPDLFRTELRRAFELITTVPGAGPLAANPEISGVRRVVLRRTGYHVYYLVFDETVTVIAIWHVRRARGPDLRSD